MQNIKNKEGRSIKETREGIKEKREIKHGVDGGTMGRKGKKEEEEGKNRIKQKEEEYDEIFKRSKLVARSKILSKQERRKGE